MAKEELYHIALDDYEHGIVIRSLNDEKTDLMIAKLISISCYQAFADFFQLGS